MNLKHLAVAVGVLSVAALAVHVLNRPAPKPSADARLGQTLVASSVIESATGVRLQQAGQSIEVRKRPDGTWFVPTFHDLDADFSRLSQVTEALTTAKWKSFVSQSPEVLQRLELATLSIALLDEKGTPSWTLQVGKNFDGGGRFARLSDEARAFVTDLSLWVDTDAKNWVDSRLLPLKPEDVQTLRVRFPNGESLTLKRDKPEGEFFATDLPPGRRLRLSQITSAVSALTALRFTNIVEVNDARVGAAQGAANSRTFTVTTFAGHPYTVTLHQAPPAPAPTPAADPKALPPPRPAENPVFVEVTSSHLSAPLQKVQETRRFEILPYLLTSLPADPAQWTEAVPTTPAQATADPAQWTEAVPTTPAQATATPAPSSP